MKMTHVDQPKTNKHTRRFWSAVTNDNKTWLRSESEKNKVSMSTLLMLIFFQTRGKIPVPENVQARSFSFLTHQSGRIWAALPREVVRDIRMEAENLESSLSDYINAMITYTRAQDILSHEALTLAVANGGGG